MWWGCGQEEIGEVPKEMLGWGFQACSPSQSLEHMIQALSCVLIVILASTCPQLRQRTGEDQACFSAH